MKKLAFSPNLEIIGIAEQSLEPKDSLPLYLSTVSAGFPSPADDYLDRKLDLHEYLIKNEASTFFLRAHGDSMINASINDGDLLIVDRAYEPLHRRIVIAVISGELTVKRIVKRTNKIYLVPENPNYPEIDISEQDVHIWGVVTNVIHHLL